MLVFTVVLLYENKDIRLSSLRVQIFLRLLETTEKFSKTTGLLLLFYSFMLISKYEHELQGKVRIFSM